MTRIFVTGISTEVGKTLAAAVLVEALQADYWKPVQAGDLDATDSHKIAGLVSNSNTTIHPSTYELSSPMSPHAAADIDGIHIEMNRFRIPKSDRPLIIEGAGGLLVPLNNEQTILDLIRPEYRVVVVSRHYLGSINHTLLTLEVLRQRGIKPYLLYNGKATPTTEQVIETRTGVPVLGRIDPLPVVNREAVRQQALKLGPSLASHKFS